MEELIFRAFNTKVVESIMDQHRKIRCVCMHGDAKMKSRDD